MHVKTTATILLRATIFLIALCSLHTVQAQNYPTGFTQVLVTGSITNPTTMAASPDGRLFIAQQNGVIRILSNGTLLTKPFITLPVQATGERGLLGIAFHPAFASNHFIYLYYTIPSGAYNRISRFTTSGDSVIQGSERIILNLDSLSVATNHNGGTMQFGADGKLYVGIGENAMPTNAQNLDTYFGKILRINDDGTVPTGNPFTTGSAQRKRVWAYGLRNPFTLSIHPSSGKIFVNDVGEKTMEEINDCSVGGGNYGWPAAEGMSANSTYRNPSYSYPHGTGDGQGCAITGGTFFAPPASTYPAEYFGSYFFLDYCSGWIDRLSFTTGGMVRSPFSSGIPGRPVSVATGGDGNLYFLSRANSALYKIVYTLSGKPLIASQPVSKSASVGTSVSFSVTVSGNQPMSFQWMKNGNSIELATNASYSISEVVATDSGLYTVRITNNAGQVVSAAAKLTVTAKNSPPVARIITPLDTATYAGGQSIKFSGSGSDAEDGTLRPASFQWFAEFFHDSHSHPGMYVPDSSESGSFIVPFIGETSVNVFYRLYLVVTDTGGATDTVYHDIHPRLSAITFNSSPQGLQLLLDGQPVITPYIVSGVEGMKRTIGAPANQVVYNALKYTFSSWLQGGTANQTIITPVADASYTARYKVVYRAPDNPVSTISGLNYKYYEGAWSALPSFPSITPTLTGSLSTISLSPRKREDYFAFRYEGFLYVPANGIYSFYTNSDEGSRLLIDTNVVVKNDGLHTARQASGKMALLSGKHRVSVEYFERTGSQSLIVSYSGPGITKQSIPATAWFRLPSSGAASSVDATALFDRPSSLLVDIYPNPAIGEVTIRLLNVYGSSQLRISDLQGRLIREQLLNFTTTKITTRDLPPGTYLFSIDNSQGRTNRIVTIRSN